MVKSSRKLLLPEREAMIISALSDGARSIAELSAALEVSQATVRRDLLSLESRGAIQRVHGGAAAIGDLRREPLFNEKASLRAGEKELIAERALQLIHHGDSIYLDGGSTVLSLARKLGARKGLTVVTNSVMAALELMESPHKLILLGGEFRPLSRTIVGPLTLPVASELHISRAFFGTIGISGAGLSTTDPGEAYTKKLILARAKSSVLLADSGKFGHDSLCDCGALDDLDVVISDSGVPAEFVRLLKKHKVELITV